MSAPSCKIWGCGGVAGVRLCLCILNVEYLGDRGVSRAVRRVIKKEIIRGLAGALIPPPPPCALTTTHARSTDW